MSALPPPVVTTQIIQELTSESEDALELWRRLLAVWRADVAAFAWDVFGIRLWRAQRRIAAALAKAAATGKFVRIAVKSGQKTGKSLLVAIIALWWWTTRSPAKVVIMAPTGRQVRSVVWTELSSLWVLAKKRLPEIGGLGGRLHQMPALGLNHQEANGERCDVIGFSANKPENAAGISGDGLLYLIDEASGIAPAIFEAIEGNRMGGASLVLFSNPTQTTGEFFDAFNGHQSEYIRFTLSSEETPNVIAGRRVIPGLATREQILAFRRKWGPDYKRDPRYRVRVLGEFPLAGTNKVITHEQTKRGQLVWYTFAAQLLGREALLDNEEQWSRIVATARELHRVREAWESKTHEAPLCIGVDPARFGDDLAVIRPRRGYRLFRSVTLPKCDGQLLADEVLRVVRLHRRSEHERPPVFIDSIGLASSPVDFLRPSRELHLVEVNSGESPSEGSEDDYVNLRAELHFGLSEWIDGGGGWEPHESLEKEMREASYFLDRFGRVQIEEKKLIKARLGRSPDEADAAALAVRDIHRAPPTSTKIFAHLTKTRFQARGPRRFSS